MPSFFIYSEHNLSSSNLKRFSLVSICTCLALFFNLSISSASFEFLDLVVVDTILGEDTFYSFEKSKGDLPIGEYRLALRGPDLKVVNIDEVDFKDVNLLKPYRIESPKLNVSGRYDLLLIDDSSGVSEIVLREEFFVNESKIANTSDFDISNWLQANLFGIGGDDDLLNSDNRFDIKDLPDSIDKDVPLTFELEALNDSKEVDVNYSGTVSIEVLGDPNAVVPSDYTFVLQDAGKHKFVEGIVFSTTGEKTIRIEDSDNDSIFAELKINVLDDVVAGDSTLLQIDSPVSGLVSDNRILVKGTTEPGLEVVVLESNAEFSRFDADVDGTFTELLPPLEDGVYKFSFKVNETTSQEYNVEINTGGVSVRSFDLSSNEVEPSSIISVEVELTKESSEVSVIVNGVKTTLNRQDIAGTFFSGQITAPISTGQYPLSLFVVDELGNSESLNSGSILTVSSGSTVPIENNVGGDFTISNIEGVVGDKQVLLSWDSNLENIVFYSIKYGQSIDSLGKMVDTNGNVNSWYVPGLENETTYFFQIVGIDRDGNEVSPSEIFSIELGRPGDTSLFGDNVDPGETSDTGPGLIFLFIFAGLGSFGWRYRFEIIRKLLP